MPFAVCRGSTAQWNTDATRLVERIMERSAEDEQTGFWGFRRGVRSLSLGFQMVLETSHFVTCFSLGLKTLVAKADKPDLAAKWLRKASDLRLHAQADPQ